jgi:flagellar biosynthetic protein FliQ
VDELQTIELARAALMLVLTVAGPMLVASLVVGVIISLFQALTQVQEMTLTFVPKILVIGTVLLLCLPMIGKALGTFMMHVADMIVTG